MRILIVEDEPQMAGLLAHGLEEELYEVRVAKDGKAALDLSTSNEFDVILLDVMLPKIGGLEVARQLRQREQSTPLLMLTARDALGDIVKGLDAGADDYLTKPFSFQELLARIRALVRRHEFRRKTVVEAGDLVLDTTSFRAFRAGREVYLSESSRARKFLPPYGALDGWLQRIPLMPSCACCAGKSIRNPRPK